MKTIVVSILSWGKNKGKIANKKNPFTNDGANVKGLIIYFITIQQLPQLKSLIVKDINECYRKLSRLTS
ncbi:hypothetical protein FFWV33_03255 [Flavobacterium faecale]|uniref:Uncharacterized protein n=1 Tax=Flavobacterium faecale TaxID=1355330 RepID=A0A2S1LA29_9FLAO|nr:hypothetical protein FFWV33_03255 [Flavobacterium faecale]